MDSTGFSLLPLDFSERTLVKSEKKKKKEKQQAWEGHGLNAPEGL